MKNIAYLVYDINKIGGAERITVSVANQLSQYYNVFIVSVFPIKDTPYEISDNIRLFSLDLDFDRVYKNSMRGILKLRRFLKKQNINIFCSAGIINSLFMVSNLFLKKCHSICIVHNSMSNIKNNKRDFFLRRIGAILSDHIVVLTERNRNSYISKYPISKKKISYIYNPIIIPHNQPDYNFESHRIITIGRIEPEKGFDLLIEVASELIKINKEWIWDIYGDGSMRKAVEGMIRKNGMQKKIILHGFTTYPMDEYPNHAMYVLTSYREGLPLVLLEAKANRLPIVSFDIETGPDEIVRNNVNGYLIQPYDIKEMANRINELLIDKDKRKAFSDQSYLDMYKFEMSNIIDQWKRLIENLCQ